MSGTDLEYAATSAASAVESGTALHVSEPACRPAPKRHPRSRLVPDPTALRPPYAMSGTHSAHRFGSLRAWIAGFPMEVATVLRTRYAMSGTDLGYAATRL
eukprot:1080420-Rhodomonas_salina.3